MTPPGMRSGVAAQLWGPDRRLGPNHHLAALTGCSASGVRSRTAGQPDKLQPKV